MNCYLTGCYFMAAILLAAILWLLSFSRPIIPFPLDLLAEFLA